MSESQYRLSDSNLKGLLGPQLAANNLDELSRAAIQAALASGRTCRAAYNPTVEVREILHWQTALVDPRQRLARSRVWPRFFNPGEAVARFFFMLSGVNSLEQIAFYLPAGRLFSADGVSLTGHAHGFRMFQRFGTRSQFETAAQMLVTEGESNRAVISVQYPTDSGAGLLDLPCPMSVFFFRRGDTVHASVHMRANDVLRLLVYDVFEFSMAHEYMAAVTGLQLGILFHGGHVLQIFGRERIPLASAVAEEQERAPAMAAMPLCDHSIRAYLLAQEARIRYTVGASEPTRASELVEGLVSTVEPYWADLLVTLLLQAAAVHFDPKVVWRLADISAIQKDFVVTSAMIDYLASIVESTRSCESVETEKGIGINQ